MKGFGGYLARSQPCCAIWAGRREGERGREGAGTDCVVFACGAKQLLVKADRTDVVGMPVVHLHTPAQTAAIGAVRAVLDCAAVIRQQATKQPNTV